MKGNMKTFLIIITAVLFTNLTVKGQNLFLIGEKSYPCTKAITLESNAQYQPDLDLFVAKDGKTGLLGVNTKSLRDGEFSGKLIIYLEDGNVLTCNESEESENVDNRPKALYLLTSDQLNKLKTSKIHTVKYSLESIEVNNYSASNKGIATNALISEFFNE